MNNQEAFSQLKDQKKAMISWLKENLNGITFPVSNVNTDWHLFQDKCNSEIKYEIFSVPIDESNSNGKFFFRIYSILKRIARSIYQELAKFFDKITKKDIPVKLLDSLPSAISSSNGDFFCCLCGQSYDTLEDPLRIVLYNQEFKNKQPSVYPVQSLFQYFLLKNLGVIPEILGGDTYVHYSCAKKSNPGNICPFTNQILTMNKSFSLGRLLISKTAREKLVSNNLEDQMKVLEYVSDLCADFGLPFLGIVYLIDNSANPSLVEAEKEMAEGIITRSEHLYTFSVSIEEEEGETLGYHIDSGASVYEIQFAYLNHLIWRADTQLKALEIDDTKSKDTKKLLTIWLEAELIRRVSNNQVYFEYYLKKFADENPNYKISIEKIIKSRRSNSVAKVLREPNILPSEKYISPFLKNKALELSKTKKSVVAETQEVVAETQEVVAETQEVVAETQEAVAETQEAVAETQEAVAETQEAVVETQETARNDLSVTEIQSEGKIEKDQEVIITNSSNEDSVIPIETSQNPTQVSNIPNDQDTLNKPVKRNKKPKQV